jgi:RHS repeat-associated protein
VTYDNAGNVTVDSKFRNLQFQYDANNRQKQSANLDSTGAVVSVYDAGGQRVATQVSGSLANVLVYDALGKLVAEYGQPTAGSGGTSYLMSDQQGSPRAVTNSSGAVISRHDYLPFGEEIGTVGMRTSGQGYSAGDNTRQKYAGMETDDATGMSHTLWRQYDSSSGRWTSPDPYTGSMTIANPQSFNRYSYVGNDPVDMTDPSGLMTKEGQPDPDAADPKNEPPGDPFETGRSITAEAEARYNDDVAKMILANKEKDSETSGSDHAPPAEEEPEHGGDTGGDDGKAGDETDPAPQQQKNPYQQPPDPTKNPADYNCVGLACRTYQYQGDLDKFKQFLATGRQLEKSSQRCKAGEIKFWLWVYELHFVNEKGNDVWPSQIDFHTVAGQSNRRTGADPTNVYSKNGSRPIHGPGTGPSFRPPARERATENNMAERPITINGIAVYKERRNMKESCYCLPRPK